MNGVATNLRASVVPRPSTVRPKAATLVAAPAPPAAGSKAPPRAASSSVVDLADADIVEVKPAAKPMPKPISRILPKVSATGLPAKISYLRQRDPLERVKEAVGELEYFATPWQAAGVCAQALAQTLGARAIIIHSYDARTTELRVVAAQGPKADALLGASALVEDDFVGSTVVANRKPMALFFGGELPRIAPERLRAMNAEKSLLAAPAVAKGEVVALVEVVDAKEANVAIVEKAVAHVAAQLGAFLAAKQK